MMTAPDNQEYIPRNLMDHMNPYFAKQHHHHHHHAHSYGHHSHSHNHSRHPHNHTSDTSTSRNSYPTPTPSSCNSGLQTPVPRRSSLAHADPLPSSSSSSSSPKSYNTPPATPPLSFPLPQVVTPGLVSTASATATTTTEAGSRKEPVAWCTARARIPTPDGSEYFLHIYENSQDKKEHLAFVFGDAIRSRSLDKVQPSETEMDRVKRGAYTGRLQPIPAAVNAVSVDHSLTSSLPLFQEQEQTTAMIVEVESTTATTELSTAGIAATTTTTTATTSATALMEQDQKEDTVMSMATPSSSTPLVRIHSECFTGEIGHSARCDCGEQLDEAIRRMKEEGADLGYDTVMANLLLNHGADERTYEVAQGILEDLDLDQIRLLTNNPDKIEQIERDSQIRVVERVPMVPKSWEALEQGVEASEFEVKEGAVENKTVKGKELDRYLKVKVERMRHLIPIPGAL
ncbi:GTP cyclohydrolase II [Mortierella sp. AD032]|nr:GTP cyclohydrolase II [Mortierella sp. AD032]